MLKIFKFLLRHIIRIVIYVICFFVFCAGSNLAFNKQSNLFEFILAIVMIVFSILTLFGCNDIIEKI